MARGGQPLRPCAPAPLTQGSRGQPPQSAANGQLPPFAPKRPFGTFRCSGRLIFRKSSSAFSPKRSTSRFAALTLRVSSHRNIPSECPGVAHGLFYDFAPSSMRTPVFRSAYSASRNARAPAASWPPDSAPWLDLQNAHASGSLCEPCGYRGAEDSPHPVPCGCRNVREGDAAENGGEERRKVVEKMTCL